MLNSEQIKAALLAYYRFKRQAVVCAEWNYRDITVFFPKKKQLIEVEVKISISDLRADFKKSQRLDLIALETGKTERPQVIRDGVHYNIMPIRNPCINALYYAVPSDIVERTIEILAEKMPFAGIIEIQEKKYGLEPVTRKTAKKLAFTRKDVDHQQILLSMAKRMSSDLANFYDRNYLRKVANA